MVLNVMCYFFETRCIYHDARSRVWTRATVLDGHGGVCVTTYRQVSSTFIFKGEFDMPHIHVSTFGSRSYSVTARQAWNHLPADIWWLSTISTFKRHLKTYLFMTAYSCSKGYLRPFNYHIHTTLLGFIVIFVYLCHCYVHCSVMLEDTKPTMITDYWLKC